ncbi:MAG: HAD family phosphatase [Oscillospiraceae bacterium]|nr:HAD family phosphatase [Oscillospiraceae bacterium]
MTEKTRGGASACEAVIFDLDGVLLDSERVAQRRWRQIGAEMGLEGIDAVYLRCVGTNPARTRSIMEEAYGPRFSMEEFYRRLLAGRPQDGRAQMPVKPGARETLEALAAAGVPLAIASSSPEDYIRRELGGADLLRFFSQLVSGDMVTHSKPHPEIFLRAAALCGARPEAVWVVEDSFNGVRAAYAAGMHPVMVPDLLPPDAEMREKAEVILPDLPAVRTYLLETICRTRR